MHSQRGGKLGQSVRYAANTMALASAHTGPSPLHLMHASGASRGRGHVYAAVASPLNSAKSQMSRSGSSRRSLFSFRPQSLKRGLGKEGSGHSNTSVDDAFAETSRGQTIMSMSRRGSGGTILVAGGVRRQSSQKGSKGSKAGRAEGAMTLDMDHIRELPADDEAEDAKDEEKAIRAIGSDLNVVRR